MVGGQDDHSPSLDNFLRRHAPTVNTGQKPPRKGKQGVADYFGKWRRGFTKASGCSANPIFMSIETEQSGSLHQSGVRREPQELRGLERLCKLYGRMKCGDVMMAWDYANDVALPEDELRADKERWNQSERTRWMLSTRSTRMI